MPTGLSARNRAHGCVIAVTAVLTALVLPLTPASTSWAGQPGGSEASTPAAGTSTPAEALSADREAPTTPIVEAVPAADVAQQGARPSAGAAPAAAAVEQEVQRSAEVAPAADVAQREVQPSAAVDARQAEPAPDRGDPLAPAGSATPAEPVEITAPVPAPAAAAAAPAVAPDASVARAAVPVAAPTPDIVCASSAFYAVSSDGAVQQVVDGPGTNDASFVPVGSWSMESPAVDGLGIAGGGGAMYAVDVTRTGVDHVLAYTAAAGWEVVPSSFEHRNSEPLVAGAVNLATGRYYVGGYHVVDPTTVSFRLYSVDVEQGELALVGQLSTGLRPRVVNSGDMAFDTAGNLYVLHGSHDGGVVFTIAASELADPGPGGELAATASARLNLNGLNEGNGIAFSSTGTSYISDPHHVRQFVPGTWSTPDNLVTVLHGSTDLASCSTPAAVSLGSEVEERIHQPDQSEPRTVEEAGTVPTTTTGEETGVQPEQAGALPVVAGSTSVTVTELIHEAAQPPVVEPLAVLEPEAPAKLVQPPVGEGPLAGLELEAPEQLVQPVASPALERPEQLLQELVSGLELEAPEQLVLPPVVEPLADPEPVAPGKLTLPPVVEPLADPEPVAPGKLVRAPSLGEGRAPVIEAPQPLPAGHERELDAEGGAGATALPVTGGDRETLLIATAGVLLASLGLVLIGRRRTPVRA